MSRNPLPANVKILTGRGNGRDAGGRLIPEAPAFRRQHPTKPSDLDPLASEMWDKVVRDLFALELLKEIDENALRGMVECYSRWAHAVELRKAQGLLAQNPTTGVWHKAPWVTIEEVAAKELMSWYARFGMTPADEMRLAKDAGSGAGNENDPGAAFA